VKVGEKKVGEGKTPISKFFPLLDEREKWKERRIIRGTHQNGDPFKSGRKVEELWMSFGWNVTF
jgi:hypothetical protein